MTSKDSEFAYIRVSVFVCVNQCMMWMCEYA